MILGLGTDLCEIARISAYLERFGERFTRRCFTTQEIAYCQSHREPSAQFAARIAAKEAACKALGTGLRDGINWKCFEVHSQKNGRPLLRIHGRAAELASQMGVANVHISLTHDGGMALAVVIFESE